MTKLRTIRIIIAIMVPGLIAVLHPVIAQDGGSGKPAGSSGTSIPGKTVTSPQTYLDLTKRFKREKGLSGHRRIEGIRALLKFVHPHLVDFLIEHCKDDLPPSVREEYLLKIASYRTAKARDFLLSRLKKGPDGLKPLLIKALGTMKGMVPDSVFIDAFKNDKYVIIKAAAEVLCKSENTETIDLLLKAYATQLKEEDGRFAGIVRKAVDSIETRSVLEWMAKVVLHSKKKYHRTSLDVVIPLLGKRKIRSALSSLKDILHRGKDNYASLAAEALGLFEDPSVVGDLIRAAEGGKNFNIKCAAIFALMRYPSDAVLPTIIKLSRSGRWEVRTASVRALGGYTSPESVNAAVKALGDSQVIVQFAAVATLGKLRSKESIDPLIKLMNDSDGRLHGDVREVLRSLLDADLGEAAEDWRRWWEGVKKDFVILKKEPEIKKVHIGPKTVLPEFFGYKVPSNRVIFIIDISYSMHEKLQDRPARKPAGSKIEYAKKELLGVVRKLKRIAKLNIIVFRSDFKSWKKRMVQAKWKNRSDAATWVKALRAGGGTNIFDPLEFALRDKEVDTIYILSDGMPGSGKYVVAEDILREISKINRIRCVKINTIAFGTDSDLLKKLARQNFGEYSNKKK